MSDIQFHRKMGIEPGKTLTDAILACDYPKGQHAKLLEEVEVCGKRVRSIYSKLLTTSVDVGECDGCTVCTGTLLAQPPPIIHPIS